ncbi:unnamed protein product [Dovyalis caffra]|uniref:Uncharacterized protein n=1 Tax=Dovyalis caffra TaxID=77055 RepID=A0AAV1RGZ6_9ROSI|nr:unnamed protein product [Dovyalis caffra]
MAKLLLFAYCVLPSVLVSEWSMIRPCATVRIECRDRIDLQLRYSLEGVTDSTGTCEIKVVGDQADRLCRVVLVDSPLDDCKTVDPVRNCAEIILTRVNGAISDLRFANSLGLVKDKALPGCAELVKKLLESDE